MTASLSTKSRFRTVLIVVASTLIVVGAASGTILLLKRYAPAKTSDDIAIQTPTSADMTPLKKAENLFAKGDYTGAKTQYQSILETYKSQNNETGIKDVEMQLQIIDATANAKQAPQNTDRNRVTAGSKSE